MADNQAVATNEDTPVVITLTGSDVDEDTLTFQIINAPGSGTLTGTPPNLAYTPNAHYHGSDSFTFTAADGQAESNIAAISITIIPVNDPPIAVDDAFSTDESQAITTGNVLANDTDNDEDDLAISGFTQPANGTVTNHGDGTFTYTPNPGFNGMDSFNYTVSDGNGGSDTAAITIEVIPGSLEVAITSPAEGAQFTTDSITVTGTVSRTSASVFVNGVAATVNGNEFTAENVPLVPGANTIGVLAEDGPHTAVAGITVIRITDMDLEPVQIETTSIPEDDGSLKVSGQATITVANNGNSAVTTPYTIVLFEDTNVSGSYEETEDNLLGEIRVPEGPGAGEAVNVSIEFVGDLLFRDNRMHVFVDSADELEESDEDNNVIATPTAGVDLSASLLRLNDTACPERVLLTVRMGNAGAATISQGISVAFYDGNPASGGILIGTVFGTQTLEPGHYEDLSFQWTTPPTGIRSIHAVVDDDGTATGTLDEPNEANNRIFSEVDLCPPLPPVDGISGQVIDAVTGAFLAGVTVSLHTDNDGSPGTLIDQLTSDDNGYFIFSGLNAGEYVLAAASPSYITAHRRAVLISGEPLIHQDLVLSPVLNADELRIVLTWGEQPADLEAHITTPNPDGCRFHCFYWNQEITGARLDLDDTKSYGPETITITQKNPGTYRFYVHDFTNRLASSGNALAASGAKVTVYSGSGDDPVTFTVPSGPGTVWHVFNLDGITGEITPIEKMTHQDHPGHIDFPKITSYPVTGVAYGETYTYPVEATDPDLDTLTYRIIEGPAGMTIDPFTGLIEWTPTSAQGGWHDIEIRVSDGRCGEDTQVFRLYVTYLPVAQFSVVPCSGFNPGGDITLTWQTDRAETVVIDPGIGEVAANGSLTIPSPDEPIAYTMTAGNDAGQVQRAVPQLPTLTLNAQPDCVSPGENSTLTWSSACAVACSIDQGIGEVPINGSRIIAPTGDTTYRITCTNGAGSSSIGASVNVSPPDCGGNKPMAEIIADPDCNWSPGDPVTLSWTTAMVDACEIDQGIGSVPIEGSIVVTPTEPTTYTLNAYGPNGGTSADVTIPRTPTIQLYASPINLGESTTLSWSTQCADTCTIDQGIGEVATTGSLIVTPAELPATYTLTATNEGHSVTESFTITPRIPTATFTVSPSQIKAGESATLSWTTINATACTIEPDIGAVALNGNISVQPDRNIVYTLIVDGPGGTIQQTATVTYILPTVEIYANPEILDEGETATLTWVFSNADTCTIDQGIGEVQLGGNVTVDPVGTTTYTITATGSGGTATDSVTVTCLEPTAAISADPQSISLGETTTLAWNVDHAAEATITPGIGSVAFNDSITVMPTETTTYTLTASGRGGTTVADVTVAVTCPPIITVLEPDGSGDIANSTFTISWDDADCDDNAMISLYYDTDTAGGDGILIADGLEEDPEGRLGGYYSGDLYIWNTLPVPEGTYYVYAVIDDGTHDPVIAYSEAAVTIDHSRPPLEEVKLTADDGDSYDYFGHSVGISDDYAVVGVSSGSVYVFKREDGAWNQMTKLPVEGEAVNDDFGTSVAISGEYLIIGANEYDMGGIWTHPGSAYIYKREGSNWTQQALLTAADPEVTFLGASVDIDGDYAVAGTFGGDYQGMIYPGSAHIFVREGSAWTEVAQLSAGDARQGGYFGNSVAIDGDYVIVGANTHHYGGNGAPAAYIFNRDGTTWSEQVKLTSGSNASGFGISVDIHADTAIVGTTDNVVYVFKRTGDSWEEQAQLVAGDTSAGDRFGTSLSLTGDYAVIGAGKNDDDGTDSGSAYIFKREGDAWIEQGKITASDAGVGDEFGNAVAMGDGQVIVGASRDDDHGTNSGAAYIYETCVIDVSVDPRVIQPGETATLSWQTVLADLITIDPDIGSVDPSGSVTVSPAATTAYTITATGPFGAAVRTATVYVGIGPPTVSITATPDVISIGDSSTLTWDSTDADTVTIEPLIGSVDPTGSTTVTPADTTTYTITATGPEGTATADITVTVAVPAPTVTLSADPVSITLGDSATLTWSTTHADTVSIDNGVGNVDLNGSLPVSPAETTTYTITATGPGGTATADVTVTVTAAPTPTVSITADPATIQSGESSILTWTSTDADTVTIDQGIGAVDINGSITVLPTETTTYTITATGPGGTVTASATITVTEVHPMPTVSITADPDTIQSGESSTLTWTSTDADTVSIDQGIGSVGANGSTTVTPIETTTYTISATGPGGTTTASATIEVTYANSILIGRVVDVATLNPIEGVAVTVTDSQQTQSDVTDGLGQFRIENISQGSITVTFTKDGYTSIEHVLTILPLQTIDIDVSMRESVVEDITLRGIVIDEITDEPLHDATVTVTNAGQTLSVQTQSDGAYEITGIILDEAEITVTSTGYASAIQQIDFNESGIWQIDFGLYSESDLATVHGTITNAKTLQPEPDVGITIVGTDISAESGPGGAFTLLNVPVGTQSVSWVKEGFTDGTITTTVNIDQDPFQLDLIYPLNTVPAYPEETDTDITGYVYDAVSGQPIEGAIVTVIGSAIEAVTGPDGQYTLMDLPLGERPIIAKALGHEAVLMTPTVVPGAADTLHFSLPPMTKGGLIGTVTDADTGEPIRYVEISIGEGALVGAQTEADGTYAMVGVPFGTHTVTVNHPAYLSTEVDSVVMEEGEATTVDVTLTHKPETGSLEGVVTDKDTGNPVAGAILDVEGTTIGGSTDTNGYYYLEGLQAGLVTILIEAEGYPSTDRTTAVVADEDDATPTATNFDIILDAVDPAPPDSVSEIITSENGGVIESADRRFMVVIPPGALSGDAIVTLMEPTSGPTLSLGDDLNLDPELNMSEIKTLGKMIQLVVEPAVEGDEIPAIEGWVVLANRFFQSEVEQLNIAESSIFPYYWDGTHWTVMQIKPHETAVDEINNQGVAVVNFSTTETGSQITAKLGLKEPVLLAALDNHIPKLDVAFIYFFTLGAKVALGTYPFPNGYIYDKDELDAVANLQEEQVPDPNALPLLITHGWDWKSIFYNQNHTDPNTDERYQYIVEDLANATNGVYRPMFATHNPRAGIIPIGNDLANKFGAMDIKGLPPETGGDTGEFPYLDTFGYSMGGLINRALQSSYGGVHNMVITGTPNHGTHSVLRQVAPNFSGAGRLLDILKTWSPGTADLFPYDDRASHAIVSDNPRLYRLNKSPSCIPQADMTLIAGTDGVLDPLIDPLLGENDKVVPVDSVFCRTTNPNDGNRSLLAVAPGANKYEITANFDHFNFGGEGYRIETHPEVENPIIRGLSDWVVGKQTYARVDLYDDNQTIQYADFTVEVQYNVYGWDIDRVALVIYAQDENMNWHVRGTHVDIAGNITNPQQIDGNSKEAGSEIISTSQLFREAEEILNVIISLQPLKPGQTKVSLEPEGGFRLPIQ